MLKRQSKVLSIALIFVFCMSFMFAGFAAPNVAQAAVTYSAISVPVVQDNTAAQQLGIIQVDLDNCGGIRSGDVLTVSFSSEINLDGVAAGAPTAISTPMTLNPGGGALTSDTGLKNTVGDVMVYFPVNATGGNTNALTSADVSSAAITATKTTLDITFNAVANTDAGRFLIYFNNVNVGSVEDEVVAQIMGQANSAFPMGNLTVAKLDSGGVLATIKSVKSFGTGGGVTDTISITETVWGKLPNNDTLKLKLPAGFTWTSAATTAGTYSWGYAGRTLGALTPGGAVGAGDYLGTGQLQPNATDARILEILIPATGVTTGTTGSGQLRFSGTIAVDDAVAKEGEIIATLSDTSGEISDTEITVGKYVSFGAEVVEGTKKEIIAGKHDQKIGTFYIEENVGASLIGNRAIKLVLPKGVKWSGAYEGGVSGLPPAPKREKGNAGLAVASCASPYDTLKLAVTSGTNKSKWEFKDYRVDIAPDFSGDLNITITGDAGISGEVTVAVVNPALELSAEDVTKVRIGEQSQALGTMILKETKKENVALNSVNIDTWAGGAAIDVATMSGELEITLPAGAEWAAGYPKVEVTEGDLQLKVNDMSKSADNRTIFIPVKSEGAKPSTIKITEMKATLYRTVPEGEFNISVTGNAINETGGQIGGVNLAFPQYEAIKVAVANCVTPAPVDGTEGAAAGQFKINSNIYEVNGVSKVMDVAPYIKNSRTYVPVRYLGYALGVADADIVWDEASQKVTLTKGDNVVEMTIGSTTITVNGEAQTMDVAPEIANSRTMLPARFVAEGLGYNVGWDPGTQTVLISK